MIRMSIHLVIALSLLTIVAAGSENNITNALEMDNPKLGKILITHRLVPDIAREKLERNFDVVFPESDPPTREEILELSRGAIGILWATHSPLNAEALDAAGPQLKAISTMSAGLDYADIPEVKRRGIAFGYTPSVLNDAVADMAVGLMIAAGRRFHEGDMKIRNGEWTPGPRWMLGKDIRGSTVGIVGLGMIGQTIAKRLQGFDIGRLVYTGHRPKSPEVEKKYSASFLSFNDLIAESDYVVIAAPLNDETRNMFNRTVFEQMKSSAILINIARGGIVNQEDLYLALKNKQIFSAGLDVMNPEPVSTDDPILSLENLVIVPHLGSATERTRSDMAEIAALNILTGIAGEPLFAPVP